MSKYKLGKQELQEHWDDQIRFLQKSIKEFDLGDEKEAQRLATHLRILFHETSVSKSIFSQLKPNIIFYSMYFKPEISFLFRWTFSIICAILAEGTAVTRTPKFADWKREAVNYKITAVRYWEGLSQFLPEQFRYL